MNKRSVGAVMRQIEKQKQRIAKECDRLDDLIWDAQQILDDCKEADEHLELARDALSRML